MGCNLKRIFRPIFSKILPRRLKEWLYNGYQKVYERRIVKIGNSRSLRLKRKSVSIEDYPVDFVVTWVDGNDPKWLSEKEKYKMEDNEEKEGNQSARYREWGLFMYWFRGVEKYAPWVRNVYLVTYGHIPKWLNTSHPKLKVIEHSQFIPHQYLPTFNSRVIEFNIWRIKGLSEHFVYFNDDTYLNRHVEKSDFFCNGLPKYSANARPIHPTINMSTFEHALFNNIGLFNSFYDVRRCIAEHPDKWFSHVYTIEKEYNYRAYKDGYVAGMDFTHLGVPLRLSTIEATSKQFSKKIDLTCQSKYRNFNCINHQIYQLKEIFSGTFEPVDYHYYGVACGISLDSIDVLGSIFENEEYMMVCANDGDLTKDEDFTYLRRQMVSIMEKKFPKKSLYEK